MRVYNLEVETLNLSQHSLRVKALQAVLPIAVWGFDDVQTLNRVKLFGLMNMG